MIVNREAEHILEKKKSSLFEEQRVVYMIRNYLLLKLSLERTAAA